MNFYLSTFRLIARILLAAILLQAAGPVLAAQSQKAGSPWIEICSTAGSKWIKGADVDKKSAADSHAGSKHCVFCGSTGASPAYDASHYIPVQASAVQPAAGMQCELRSSYAGHHHLSRAPPSFLI